MNKNHLVRQATFYAKDGQEFDCFKGNSKWFIYPSHGEAGKLLATFNHFPTHEVRGPGSRLTRSILTRMGKT